MMQKCKTNTDQQQFVAGPKMASLKLICYFSENFGQSLWSTLMEVITVQVFIPPLQNSLSSTYPVYAPYNALL